MAHVGYIRVSSIDQNTGRQLETIPLDKTFIEKKSGASVKDRPVWAACLDYMREGDTLHVHSLDRLARSLGDLKSIVTDLTAQAITVHFHKENLIFTNGKDDPMSTLLLHVIGSVAEFERSLIRERQREGIARAKRKGIRLGRKPQLNEDQKIAVNNMVNDGYSVIKVAEEFAVSRQTIYRCLKKENKNEKQ